MVPGSSDSCLKLHSAIADQLRLGFDDTHSLVVNYYQWFLQHQFLTTLRQPENDDKHFNFPRVIDTLISKSHPWPSPAPWRASRRDNQGPADQRCEATGLTGRPG